MVIPTSHKISDLYKTLNLTFQDEPDFSVLSIPQIHPKIPFTSAVLRADYFSFILTIDGSGTYYLDENEFPFESGSIYFTNPGHVKSYSLNVANESYLIMLTEKFLREHVHPEIFREFPFLLAEIVPPQQPSRKDFDEYVVLFNQIGHEFNNGSRYKNKILGSLMFVLLLKIKEKFWLTYNPIEEGNRSSQIVKTFKELIESEFKMLIANGESIPKLQVQHFAEKMNLHPNYLNSVIKSKTGKTVNDWISQRTVSMAKTLLLSNTYSSKQIAFLLGFSEPTHFSRFFKKHTDVSPNKFRKLKAV